MSYILTPKPINHWPFLPVPRLTSDGENAFRIILGAAISAGVGVDVTDYPKFLHCTIILNFSVLIQ